jgi:FkbM family methyltransferase
MPRIIFDVGANNGSSTMDYLQDPTVELYAFEPNPILYDDLCKIQEKNPNYHPVKAAVGETDGEAVFNLAGPVVPSMPFLHQEGISNYGCSSLLPFSETVHEEWEDRPDFQSFAKVNVMTIRLDTFVEMNSIPSIDYLHIDAQGMDLSVLKSLGKYLPIVKEGVLEAPINDKKKIYTGSHTCEEAILFLLNNGFRITDIEKNDTEGNEVNLYFKNRSI